MGRPAGNLALEIFAAGVAQLLPAQVANARERVIEQAAAIALRHGCPAAAAEIRAISDASEKRDED